MNNILPVCTRKIFRTRTLFSVTLILIAVFFIPGCTTTKVSSKWQDNADNSKILIKSPEIQGFTISPGKWNVSDTLTIRKSVEVLMNEAVNSNINSIFFGDGASSPRIQVSSSGQKSAEHLLVNDKLLGIVINEAHRNGLRVFFIVNTGTYEKDESGNTCATRLTSAKRAINFVVSSNDIDGLSFVEDEDSTGLTESLVVEAMLIKPYLINSVLYSKPSGYNNSLAYLSKGIVDFVVDASSIVSDINNKNLRYPSRAQFPENIKILSPNQVVSLDLSDLLTDTQRGRPVYINKKKYNPDSEGIIGFVNTKDTITIESEYWKFILPTEAWCVPYKYSLMKNSSVIRKFPWVEIREMPARFVQSQQSYILCKTEFPAMSVRVNDDSLKQYRTGIFFDRLTFHEGANRVRVSAVGKDSLTAFYEYEFIWHKTETSRKQYPLWIASKSISPSEDIEILPGDIVRLSFQGSRGQEGFIQIAKGKQIPCSRQDFSDYSVYYASFSTADLKTGKAYNIQAGLKPAGDAPDKKTLKLTSEHTIIVRNLYEFPFVKIAKDYSRLVYDLGAPRLGGPIRAELGPGVILKTNGKSGENYRIRLSGSENGYLSKSDVVVMPAGTVQPRYFIESMSCAPSKNEDVLTIPYTEPVPYEIYAEPEQKRLVINLFGVETASTWITHMAGRKMIDRITWQQVNPETYRIFVNLNSSTIWGYSFKPEGKRLVLRIKYPPAYDINNARPLTGLKIAIEAGHGGSGLGAVGLSGLLEKDVNLDVSFRLAQICRMMGAEVIQVRDSDKDMTLIEKRNIALKAGADILICIHANAGAGGGPYLKTAGTSTYYNNPLWAPLAENVYRRMLELGLKEFGVVGSFNYTVIRVTEMPAILVEQAFMDHAEDEEKLADPTFRQQEAQKIYEGIIDYLKSVGR